MKRLLQKIDCCKLMLHVVTSTVSIYEFGESFVTIKILCAA